MWLAFASGASLLVGGMLGSTAADIGGWIAVLCSAIAIYVVARWAMRCVGYWVGYTTSELKAGFDEGRAEVRQQRAIAAAAEVDTAPPPHG